MKRLKQPTYREIGVHSTDHPIIHVPSARGRIVVSRSILILTLISLFILMGYAGAEVGFLIGGLLLVSISYAVFELVLRAGQSILTSLLAGALTLTSMFATDLASNLIGTSIRVGESLQKISHAGLVILVLFFFASLFRRK